MCADLEVRQHLLGLFPLQLLLLFPLTLLCVVGFTVLGVAGLLLLFCHLLGCRDSRLQPLGKRAISESLGTAGGREKTELGVPALETVVGG